MAWFIGLDSGTQGTRAILVDGRDGRVAAASAVSHDLLPASAPGQKEQRPRDWIDAVSATVSRILPLSKVGLKSVEAIGISGQQHGFVPLDRHGKVIRAAKLWCDTTTAAECDRIIDRLGGPGRAVDLLGNNVLPGYTASKILWLKTHEPDHYARLATVLLPHDYIVFWLTGNRVMEYGDASGTALMDVRTRAWTREVVDAIDPALADKLPPLASSRVPAGRLRREIAATWGLKPDVLVTGSGDNMMGAIGTGNVREGIVTASFGTSGTIYGCSETPIIDPRGEVAAFCDATDRWLPLVCTMNVTVATEMVRRQFDLDHEGLSRAAGSAPVGADGLLLVPFFEGERTPNCPDGTGVWLGVREKTADAAHAARAAMEGTALGMNYGLNRLRELGIAPREIRLTGGGAKSGVWRQIAADIFDCPVVCPASEEGAAYGAALHAMWVWERERGRGVSIEDLAARFVRLDEQTRAVPDPQRAATYRRLQAMFECTARDLSAAFTLHRRFISTGPDS